MLTIAAAFSDCFLPGHVIKMLVSGLLLGPFYSCFMEQNSNADTQSCVKRKGYKVPAVSSEHVCSRSVGPDMIQVPFHPTMHTMILHAPVLEMPTQQSPSLQTKWVEGTGVMLTFGVVNASA